jgi:apoptosis-inducing factor 2
MKNVVVIGGGFTGAFVAKQLESEFKVTLLDSKNFFEFTPSILRTIVEPTHAKRVQVLHTDYLKKTKVIMVCAIKFDLKKVYLDKGNALSYDYLVIASGSSYGSGIKVENVVLASRANMLKETYGKVKEAKDIVIVGGGIVGVELAAEIVSFYPKKNITLLHSRESLIQRNSFKAQRYAKNFLEKKNVKVVLGDRAVTFDKRDVVTKKGQTILSDVSFSCVGISPHSGFVKKSYSKAVNERGAVVVNPFLQVAGFENVFAGGDVTSVNEEKTAQNAEKHAHVIAKNIKHLEKKEKLESYSKGDKPMIISLGKWHGVIEYKGYTLTGLIPGLLKVIPELKTMWSLRN